MEIYKISDVFAMNDVFHSLVGFQILIIKIPFEHAIKYSKNGYYATISIMIPEMNPILYFI